MDTKTIELLFPIEVEGQPRIADITFKPPTYGMFMELGEPETYVALNDQGGFLQPNPFVIRQYIERLASVDLGSIALLQLPDAIRAKDVVVHFFREAAGLARPVPEDDPQRTISSEGF